MALKIRLQRHGAKHAPVYRIVVAEGSSPRDGRFVELLGHYNPEAKGNDPKMKLNLERVDYWISVGAKPTDTMAGLLRKARKAEANEGVVILQREGATAA
tara:strand:- start:73232 stop:73531 length:300 start_codon:yes stop_codon:yes gene_type:complete